MSRKPTTAIAETILAAIWRTIFAPITPTGDPLVPVRATSKSRCAHGRANVARVRD